MKYWQQSESMITTRTEQIAHDIHASHQWAFDDIKR
jgi:hypothetical protein